MPTEPASEHSVSAAVPPSQPEQLAPARGRRPWHRPTLTQVALQVTGQGSGQFTDGQSPSSLG